MLRYDDETLKHLQRVQLMILEDFAEICDKNNITYFIYAGTLLGSIRHEGFIPWDDDIDVIMFRKDFEKLDEILINNPNEKYDFFNVLNEESYYDTWARFTLKNTLLKHWWSDQVDYESNIYMDIFILDNVPNNKFKRIIHKWSCFIFNQLTIFCYLKFENNHTVKGFFRYLISHILKIFPISPMNIKKKCVKLFSKYANEECVQVCDFPSPYQMPIFNKTDFLPPKTGKFENIEVKIPNNSDVILTRLYGDYMRLPPVESRFRIAPDEIDFGEY